MAKRHDLKGKRFTRLEVLEYHGLIRDKIYGWKCKCDCGNYVFTTSSNLINGMVKSCGCLKKEIIKDLAKKEPGLSAKNSIFAMYKKGARNRSLKFELSENEFFTLSQLPCHYCGMELSNHFNPEKLNGGFKYNGIDRLDNNKGYSIDNCVPCCKICNYAKQDMTEDEFFRWIDRVYYCQIEKAWMEEELLEKGLSGYGH